MLIIRRRWVWTFAVAVLSLFGPVNDFGTPSLAQVQRSGEPSEVHQPNLTGDWGGVRSYLERNGITFTLNYTNVPHRSVRAELPHTAPTSGP